ncbi:hypothetical protein [Micromonospora sp. WMMD708]
MPTDDKPKPAPKPQPEDHLTQLDSGRSNNLTDRFLSWAQPPDR